MTRDDFLPLMPVMVRDFASSASAAVMTNEQFGVYWRLLLHAWMADPPCTLPDDEPQLAAISRLSVRRWRSIGSPIKSRFLRTENGLLRNEKQWEMYLDARAHRDSKHRRAQAGARARWAARSDAQAAAQADGHVTVYGRINNAIDIKDVDGGDSTTQ